MFVLGRVSRYQKQTYENISIHFHLVLLACKLNNTNNKNDYDSHKRDDNNDDKAHITCFQF